MQEQVNTEISTEHVQSSSSEAKHPEMFGYDHIVSIIPMLGHVLGPRPGCRACGPWETGAPRNASPAQEADRSVPDDEEQPVPCENSTFINYCANATLRLMTMGVHFVCVRIQCSVFVCVVQGLPGLDRLSAACSGPSNPRAILPSHNPMSPDSIKLMHRHRWAQHIIPPAN